MDASTPEAVDSAASEDEDEGESIPGDGNAPVWEDVPLEVVKQVLWSTFAATAAVGCLIGAALGYLSLIGLAISSVLLTMLFASGLLDKLDRHPETRSSIATPEQKQSLSVFAFTLTLLGIVIGGLAPGYLSIPLPASGLFVILGIVASFQLGLPLLLLFKLRSLGLFAGFLGSALLLHALTLRTPAVFADAAVVRVMVVVYLAVALWLLARYVFIVPERADSADRDSEQQPAKVRRGDYVRYTVGVLGVIVELIQFFNIMYDIYLRSR